MDDLEYAWTDVLGDFLLTWGLGNFRSSADWGSVAGTEQRWVQYFEGEYVTEVERDGLVVQTLEFRGGLDNTILPFGPTWWVGPTRVMQPQFQR